MAYRIIDGRLQRQDVPGGRWEIVDRSEEQAAMDLLSRTMTSRQQREETLA